MFRDEAPLAQPRQGEKLGCARPPARAQENRRRVGIEVKMFVRGVVLLLFAVIRRRGYLLSCCACFRGCTGNVKL